ncbi:MAG TPA: shikimate dehydrogenase [Deltaproteobacteria bacterium]|nr:shikimate dehydrogenase [Deltaproteobacteria bacterium]
MNSVHITGQTRIVTILAHPSHHVKAPAIYNSLFSQLDMDMAYISHDVAPEVLRETLRSFVGWENLAGFNVTVPHKESVVPFLDVACPITTRAGAVNTVVRQENGTLFGYNTDGLGALGALGKVVGEHCLVIGAGGVARSIVDALLHKGAAQIWIIARSTSSRNKILDAFPSERVAAFEDRVLGDVNILIQATPVSDVIPFSLDLGRLRKTVRILETVMQPTALSSAARSCSLSLIPGHAMLYHQTRKNFKLFTGRDLPSELLNKTFESVGLWPL